MSYFATPCDKKSSFIRSIISKDKSKPSPKAVLVNAKAGGLYTYTAERMDVLGCTSPTTKRFPEAREMSRGRSPRDILRAEGNLEVGRDVQPNRSRVESSERMLRKGICPHFVSS